MAATMLPIESDPAEIASTHGLLFFLLRQVGTLDLVYSTPDPTLMHGGDHSRPAVIVCAYQGLGQQLRFPADLSLDFAGARQRLKSGLNKQDTPAWWRRTWALPTSCPRRTCPTTTPSPSPGPRPRCGTLSARMRTLPVLPHPLAGRAWALWELCMTDAVMQCSVGPLLAASAWHEDILH